jgi:hypothetical protein
MPDVRISRSDVEHIAEKLDTLESHFTDHERAVLSAVFAAAATAIGRFGPEGADVHASGRSSQPPVADAQPEATAPAVRPQPFGAFTPGKDEEAGSPPDKIGNPTLREQLLSSFTAGEDEGSGSTPDKIGRA